MDQTVTTIVRRPEHRTADLSVYFCAREATPVFVVLDGVAYRRDTDQELARMYLASLEAEAELLSLVPEGDQGRALRLIIDLIDGAGERRIHKDREKQKFLTQLLPQHAPIIAAVFDPEESTLSFDEAVRHMRCTLPAAADTTTEEGR